MDSFGWMMAAGSIAWGKSEKEALLLGIVIAAGVTAVPGVIGIVSATRTGSPRLAIVLNIPLLAIGVVLAVTGLALFLGGTSARVGIGLLGGGGVAAFDSLAFMFAGIQNCRQRQKQMADKQQEGFVQRR